MKKGILAMVMLSLILCGCGKTDRETPEVELNQEKDGGPVYVETAIDC